MRDKEPTIIIPADVNAFVTNKGWIIPFDKIDCFIYEQGLFTTISNQEGYLLDSITRDRQRKKYLNYLTKI